VDVHVDQSWQQRDIAKVHDFSLGRWVDASAFDRGDPPILDKDQRALNKMGTTTVEQTCRAKD
jgi:hypothetical protein